MSMMDSYDALETRAPEEREAALMAALPAQVAHARSATAAFGEILAGVDPRAVTSRDALAALPVTRKHELLERQQAGRAANPFGGFSALAFGPAMPRVFASPGTLYEPEGRRADYWRMARAIHAAGFRPGELVHNCFSYHFVPAGAMMEGGAQALGCTVFAGGTGQTEQQVQAMAELRPAGYIGTPSFLRILLEKAAETGTALPHLGKALVSGEALPPSLRDWFAGRGVAAYQCYATADLGLIAYETRAREGLVLGEDVIVEIVRPGTGDPVPDGEVGEVVVTTLNPDYPLVRFGTGDLSAVLPGSLSHRPHEPPHPRLDGPGRPDHQGARHVRAPRPGGRGGAALPAGGARAPRRGRRDGQRHPGAARGNAGDRRRAGRPAGGRGARGHQAARRGWRCCRRGACPTTAA